MILNRLLGQVRKKGLDRTFPIQNLPVWRKERAVSVAVGPELLALMEQIRGYQAKSVDFPEEASDQLLVAVEQVDDEAIRRHLYASLPISDLMAWLIQHYGHYQDATVLKLYHKMIRLPDIIATPNEQATRVVLKQVAVALHSHVLETA